MDRGISVTMQPDGKILLGGYSDNSGDWDFALVRYNADGTLDTGFGGGDGMLTTDFGASWDFGYSVAMLPVQQELKQYRHADREMDSIIEHLIGFAQVLVIAQL